MSLLAFITGAWQNIIIAIFGIKHIDIWHVAIGMMVVILPISLIRDVSKLSFTFIIGNLCILATVLSISFLALD